MNQPTFAIAVAFEIMPEWVEEFRERVIQQAKDSVEKEPGCIQFDVLLDESSSNSFFLYETYVDASAFDDHKQMAHFHDFNETVTPWVANKQLRRLVILRTV